MSKRSPDGAGQAGAGRAGLPRAGWPGSPVPRLACCGMSEGELLTGDGVTQGIVRIGDTLRDA